MEKSDLIVKSDGEDHDIIEIEGIADNSVVVEHVENGLPYIAIEVESVDDFDLDIYGDGSAIFTIDPQPDPESE